LSPLELKKFKKLREENGKFKRIVADLSLDNLKLTKHLLIMKTHPQFLSNKSGKAHKINGLK